MLWRSRLRARSRGRSASRTRGLEGLQQVVETLQVSLGDVQSGCISRRALQQNPHAVRVQNLGRSRLEHPYTSVGNPLGETGRHQQVEGFPHRRHADAQFRRDLLLPQPLARRVLAREDPFVQDVEDLLFEGLPTHCKILCEIHFDRNRY